MDGGWGSVMPSDVRAVILCGGKGTRAYPLTAEVPKPLIPLDDRPVLRHVMEIYAGQGVTDFVLAAGFRAELVKEFAGTLPSDWSVDVVDTGEDTNTGGRVRRCADYVGPTFCVTYGDGVGNVDVGALLQTHRRHVASGALATITAVPLPSQYGTLDIDPADRVTAFREKPVLRDHWINAGFLVFEHAAFDAWGGEDLEHDVLPTLGAAGQLGVYRHEGFWKSMDTHKDVLELARLAREEGCPWLRPAGRQ